MFRSVLTIQVRTMKRYVIERDLPGVGTMNCAQFKDVATTSNNALAKLSARLSGSISFCIYLAEDEAAVKEHAKLSGFPATKVTKVRTVIG